MNMDKDKALEALDGLAEAVRLTQGAVRDAGALPEEMATLLFATAQAACLNLLHLSRTIPFVEALAAPRPNPELN